MGGNELVTVAEALYDFNGLRSDNLPFNKGDIITVLDMNDSGWWKGSDASGRIGIFPYNYVELRDDAGVSFPIVVALYKFEPTGEGQIGFEKGDRITVIKEVSVNWWRGRTVDGEEGLFPTNYVEKTDEEDSDAAKEEKKRWSAIKKEKKKELERAAKEQASLERRERKQKDEEEKARLAKEAQEAAERARKAEEELERLRAEAALLKRQQAEKDARRSSRARKAVNKERDAIKQQARMSAMRWQGMAPGPPPELEQERVKYLSEQEALASRPARPARDDDDLFGPAPPPEAPPPRALPSEIKEAPPIPVVDEDEKPAVEEKPAAAPAPEAAAKKGRKYNSRFAHLGGGARCRKCDKIVGFADKVSALNSTWHKDCFRCSTCSMVLRQGQWREHNTWPYCSSCHAAGFGIKGFGFGGSVAMNVETGKTGKPAKGEVDDRPLFRALERHGVELEE